MDRNVIPALVGIVAHTGGAAEYEKDYDKFKNAQMPQEDRRDLLSLAAFRPAELIERTLRLTINGEAHTQNWRYLRRGILLNKEACATAWSFMKAYWDEILKHSLNNAIPRTCESIIGW